MTTLLTFSPDHTPCPRFHRPFSHAAAGALAIAAAATGCADRGRLTPGTEPRAYPYAAPVVEALDIHVFRDGPHLELANHTTHTYENFDLWLNERYVRHVDALPAGGNLELWLYEFLDEYSEPFRGGGLFSGDMPEPVVKAEIETVDGLVGLIVIPDKKKQ